LISHNITSLLRLYHKIKKDPKGSYFCFPNKLLIDAAVITTSTISPTLAFPSKLTSLPFSEYPDKMSLFFFEVPSTNTLTVLPT
jgi:hypothetical protein